VLDGPVVSGQAQSAVGELVTVDCTVSASQGQSTSTTLVRAINGHVTSEQAQTVTAIIGIALDGLISASQGQSVAAEFNRLIDGIIGASQAQSVLGGTSQPLDCSITSMQAQVAALLCVGEVPTQHVAGSGGGGAFGVTYDLRPTKPKKGKKRKDDDVLFLTGIV
jgi:hypothetical protein